MSDRHHHGPTMPFTFPLVAGSAIVAVLLMYLLEKAL
jgi:hypothetical protein